MTELFIPRQGRELSPLPLLGIPRLRPEPAPARGAALEQLLAGAAWPAARPRRGGPRHGRRVLGERGPAPLLAGAAGLLLGLGLGAAGWAGLHSDADRPPPAGTHRGVTVALR